MTAREKLAEIQARADQATPGPWVPVLDHPELNSQFVWLQSSTDADGQPNQWGGVAETGWAWPIIASSDLSDGQGWAGGVEQDAHTARFIAAARSDVPRLVAALTAVLDLCDREVSEIGWELASEIRDAITAALEGGSS